MNKKGFTLVELLAVILILSLLALLASTSITNVVRNSKSDLYNSQIKMIELAAESWGNENIELLPDSGECKFVTLSNLKEYGLIDSHIKNPKTNKEFNNDMIIKISANTSKNGELKTTYEVDSKNINECEAAIKPKTIDDICLYDTASQAAEKTAGAKYSCEVKEGTSYNFYVLTTPQEGDTTIDLIMDRNIYYDATAGTGSVADATNKGRVAWQTSGKNAAGPITAMDYLYNATKDWANIPNIEMNYTDEGNTGDYGYGTIVTTNNTTKITKKDGTAVTVLTNQEGYSNLKARLPYRSEVSAYDSTNKINAYLYDYLNQSGTIQTNAISGIYGYWTLSSYSGYSSFAWRVHFDGRVYDGGVDIGDGIGVRAVITLKF